MTTSSKQTEHIVCLVRIGKSTVAAQQALAVDAATRPQDRRHFESRFQLDSHPDLSVRRN